MITTARAVDRDNRAGKIPVPINPRLRVLSLSLPFRCENVRSDFRNVRRGRIMETFWRARTDRGRFIAIVTRGCQKLFSSHSIVLSLPFSLSSSFSFSLAPCSHAISHARSLSFFQPGTCSGNLTFLRSTSSRINYE